MTRTVTSVERVRRLRYPPRYCLKVCKDKKLPPAIALTVAVDVHLGHHREGGLEPLADKVVDVLLGALLLGAELVTGELQYSRAYVDAQLKLC